LELFEVERRMVVEPEIFAGSLVQTSVERVTLESILRAFVFSKNLRLGRREHAVETTQHRHRQHYAFVLRGTVWPAQQVCDLPDQSREIVVVRHAVGRSRCCW